MDRTGWSFTIPRNSLEKILPSWPDVDWEKSTLRVEQQLQPVSFKTGALVRTKTMAGRRAILIGPGTAALLKEHREKQEQQKLLAGAWDDFHHLHWHLHRPDQSFPNELVSE